MMGSLAGSTWAYTVLLGLPLAIGTPLFFGLARSLNLLAVGEATAASLVERARASSARPLDLVAVHLGLSDTARALDWVEQIPGDRGSNFFLLSEPMFDPLRGSPRFQRVLESFGLGVAANRADSIRAQRDSPTDRS